MLYCSATFYYIRSHHQENIFSYASLKMMYYTSLTHQIEIAISIRVTNKYAFKQPHQKEWYWLGQSHVLFFLSQHLSSLSVISALMALILYPLVSLKKGRIFTTHLDLMCLFSTYSRKQCFVSLWHHQFDPLYYYTPLIIFRYICILTQLWLCISLDHQIYYYVF